MQPLVVDGGGVVRFKGNAIVERLFAERAIDLNRCRGLKPARYSKRNVEDQMKFSEQSDEPMHGAPVTELEVAAFRRDCAALAGHVRAGLRSDGFGETARQALDKLVTLAYGAAGFGEEYVERCGSVGCDNCAAPHPAEPCPECNGTGNTEGIPMPGRWVDCPKCGDPKWDEPEKKR